MLSRISAAICFSLSILSLAGCGPVQNTQAQSVGCVTKARTVEGLIKPFHDNNDGIALSPSGRFAAVTANDAPSNEIELIDIDAMTAIVIAVPQRQMTIANPTFSPDDKSLAFVATPHGYFGVAQIWVVSLTGETEAVVGDLTKGFRYPTFSHDGKKLAYWRDVWPEPTLPRKRPKEFTELSPWALFEYDLSDKVERQLAQQAYAIPCGVFYDPKSDGLYYCAIGPMQPFSEDGTGKIWWGGGDNFEYEKRTEDARTFYFQRGHEIPRYPEPFLPKGSLQAQQASVQGVTLDGRLFLKSYVTDPGAPEKASTAGVLYDGKAYQTAIFPGWPGVHEARISADGKTAFAKQDILVRETCELTTHYYVQKGRQPLTKFKLDEVAIDPKIRLLSVPRSAS